VSKLDSGLLVVTKDERDAKEELDRMYEQAAELRKKGRILRWVGVRHHDVLDVDVKTEARMETPHKLNPEERKQRREDNKTVKEIRKKTRGRKKHGRR
jgi:hypothetical protein